MIGAFLTIGVIVINMLEVTAHSILEDIAKVLLSEEDGTVLESNK
jgi:hypothetical protein